MTRWIPCCSEQAVWSKSKALSRTLWYEAVDQGPRRRKIKTPGREFKASRTVADCSSLWVFNLLSWYCFVNNYYWNILPSGSPNDHSRLVAANQVPRGREIKAPRREVKASRIVADYSGLWVFDLLFWYCFANNNHWNILASGSPGDHIRLVVAA